jgi:hypothetical protein
VSDIIISDDPDTRSLAFPPDVGFGLVPRVYDLYPEEMFAPPSELTLIPRSEWSARIKEQVETKSRLSDIRGDMPSLNQGQSNYCWAHSTTSCVQLLRAVNNQPYVPLSAFAVAATIMKGRNEGGWCGLSAKYHREHGAPSQDVWPQGKFTPQTDAAAIDNSGALHKVTEDWADLTRQVYDQNLTFEQLATCLLTGIPCAVDFNWWSHSVCAMDLVEVEPGSFGVRILNSWGDSWGDRGTSVLQGSKAIPNGAVALRVTGASDR